MNSIKSINAVSSTASYLQNTATTNKETPLQSNSTARCNLNLSPNALYNKVAFGAMSDKKHTDEVDISFDEKNETAIIKLKTKYGKIPEINVNTLMYDIPREYILSAEEERVQDAKERDRKRQEIIDALEQCDKNDWKGRLAVLGIKVDKDENSDDGLVLSNYSFPEVSFDSGIRFSNFIDEDALFARVTQINGDADFGRSTLRSLGNRLQKIKGNVKFGDIIYSSDLEDLGSLVEVGGNARFYNKKLTSLSNLKSIGGSTNFSDTGISSLGRLEFIGGSFGIGYDSAISSLGNLKSIGGNAYFIGCENLNNLGQLEKIGGDADFQGCKKIRSLGKLKEVGGDLNIINTWIFNLSPLEHIGKDLKHSSCTIAERGIQGTKIDGNIEEYSYNEHTCIYEPVYWAGKI